MKYSLQALLAITAVVVTFNLPIAQAESYQVCVDKYTDASGNRTASLSDCHGNDYVIRPQSVRPNSVVSGSDRRMYSSGRERSSDRYQVDESTYASDRWCDDSGCYRIQNKRNLCVLEVTGELVDCN
ncbi:hypothetical protein EKN56_11070 [Limnobaculum zhutongyuii]|uniref:Cyanovirin-N domain-containing protein n=1 Tax=Limnobaculum zhutongyuii TaxID=2498113 RepID=A0A411WKY6_9GAMM|nr:hypothetical protein [Limnobaculum zhutongyuii]QBH96891.1 hypothetical protein EKN56_11070 [Limnobaculum zhutongyuii]TQS86995.1 hypothetical protein ELQ32_16385 [Limnobaculum zhutongyuii]